MKYHSPPCFPSRNITKSAETHPPPMRDLIIEQPLMGKKTQSFSPKFIGRKKIFNELQKLKSKKACQGSNITVKIIKENINIITDLYITISIIHCLVHIFYQI